MTVPTHDVFRQELMQRRDRLLAVPVAVHRGADIEHLLREVDAALHRLENGTYGLCETCHEPVETERLVADPLVRFCLDHLSTREQRALEEDLQLAARIQRGLLPKREVQPGAWQVAYHFDAAGPVSGDYCDLVYGEEGNLYFMLGDVSGKGVAASMLMSHLHAMLRALISVGMPLRELVERASRVFCESTLPTHFATLICGKADRSGGVELCNAGHHPPLWITATGIVPVESTGLPIGMFCNEEFSVRQLQLDKGDTLLLYTDGLVEAENSSTEPYGSDRLISLAQKGSHLVPEELLGFCLNDLASFQGPAPRQDDLTLMALRRT